MNAPTSQVMQEEILRLLECRHRADHTLWHVANVLIRTLEFHKPDGNAFWTAQSKFDRLLASIGLAACCPYTDAHFNDGEPLNYAGRNAHHPYYEVPVRGCNCDRCSPMGDMILETCRWIAGLNETPPSLLYRKLEDAKSEFEAEAESPTKNLPRATTPAAQTKGTNE